MVLDSVIRCYLFIYNLLQFLGFSWTFCHLSADVIIQGPGGVYTAFSSCSAVLCVCQVLAVLEVINASVGLIKAPVLPTLIQVMGRNLVLFVVFGSLKEMQSRGVVFCVFYLWSIMETFRYLVHMLVMGGQESRMLTCVWNMVWVLLYPLSTVAEGVAVLQAVPVFDQTGLFSVSLPQTLGVSISFSFSLRLHLLLLLSGLFINMRHLLTQKRSSIRLKRD